jgi:uncharacterized coiled-coil DUF342 family protein
MEEKTIVNFTEEEVGKIAELQQKVLTINTRLGEIELEIHELETRFQSLKSEKQTIINSFSEVKAEEVELGKSLRDKYGEGTYDIGTNTFTPNK